MLNKPNLLGASLLACLLGISTFSVAAQETQNTIPVETSTPVAEKASPSKLRTILLESDDAAAVQTALSSFETLAEEDAEAAYSLGNILLAGGPALSIDSTKAAHYLRVAAADGNVRAAMRLGDLYRTDTTLADATLALSNYKSAADLGDATGAYRAAEYLRIGTEVPGNVQEAIHYYEIAANAGNTRSLMRLGDIYRMGADAGLDQALAVIWYEKAAEGGDAQAYYRLGELYRVGIDGTPRLDLAVENYRLAADGGNTYALMRLARGLVDETLASGRAGEGVALLQHAVADGVGGASVYLANAMFQGKGTARDASAALDMLSSAAADGDVSAGRYLVQIYTSGRVNGVPRNIQAARGILDILKGVAEPNDVAFETVIVEAADSSRNGFTALGGAFSMVGLEEKSAALGRVYALDRNAFVYLLQETLSERGLYNGSMNGLLTTSTITAINQMCAQFEIVEACRLGPLSNTARRAISAAIFRS